MPSPDIELAVRVAAELFDRTCRVKQYLGRIGPGNSKELERLISAIKRALKNVERETVKGFRELWKIPENDEDSRRPAVATLNRTLRKFSRWFAKIHELLVLLPGECITPELVFALQHCFQGLYAEYHPSIVLGSLFNAVEFDFIEILKERLVDISEIFPDDETIVVLQLAICDNDSPLAYPILAHELGHAIDSKHDISSRIASEFVPDPNTAGFDIVKSWCNELCADIVATQALGPSPILSLLSMEYCFHPTNTIWRHSKTHPMSRTRLNVVLSDLESSLDSDLIDPEVRFYETAWRLNLERAVTDATQRQAIEQSQETLSTNLIFPMAKRVREELSSINLNLPVVRFRKDSIDRCLQRLRDGSPVSAQGESRSLLQPKVQLFQQFVDEQSFDSPEGRRSAFETLGKELGEPVPSAEEARRQAFQMLCGMCAEAPLEIPKILLSGHLHRAERIREMINEDQPLATEGSVAELCDSLADIDRLIGSSIVTTCVHEEVCYRLDGARRRRRDA